MPGPTKEVIAYNKDLFEQGLKKCSYCKEIKPRDDFYANFGCPDGKANQCKPCERTRSTVKSRRRTAELNVIKEAQGCMICGYNEDGSRLHFHHRDKSTKLFGIGDRAHSGRQTLQKEIDKCDILCASCHITYHKEHG